MTQISGFTPALPTNIILGPAVLYIDGVTAWGVSKGGLTLNLPKEYENTEFDGKLSPIAGLDRRMGGIPSFEGTFLEMTAARALELEPGGTSATTSGVTVITPKLLGEFLDPAADYKKNVRIAMRMGASASGLVVVEFDLGLLICDKIAGDPKDPSYTVKFEGRQDPAAASLGVSMYSIKLAATMTAIHAID